MPEILIVGSDLDEIVEDGKMGEFIDYIERIDNNDTIVSDKLQFKEYSEQPKRLRHSSYNYEADKDNEDKSNDFSIVENDEHGQSEHRTNENKSSDFNSKRGINNRKPNMFALASTTLPLQLGDESVYKPLIRITPTEDERVEQFLHEEQIDNTNRSSGDILIKSKTTETFDCRDESVSDVDSYGSDSRANSPTSDVIRRESTTSDIGSEPIQFECKQPENSNYIYKREDSSSSNKSNVQFERSQSRFSELEYIKGRDDWKDDYTRCDISEEIDSDNYHHLRRHSETADTLEYIRGREDWQRNELQRGRQNSLPRIFEVGEPIMLIQDEIDSDEYHHNFFQHEMFRSVSETAAQRNESAAHEAKVDDFSGQFVAKSVEIVANDGNVVDLNDVDRKSSGWTDDGMEELESNKQDSIISSTNVRFDKSNDDEINEIDVVIEDLITHDTTNAEDIEIMVWNLTPEPQKNNPFILITEATDENRETSIAPSLNQSTEQLHRDPIEITISTDEQHINNNLTMENSDSPNINTTNSTQSSLNEFLCAEIEIETKTRLRSQSESEKDIDGEENSQTTQPFNRNIRAKSERLDSMTTGLLKPSGQKPRRTLSFENVEDLIRDVSNGPWLHL